MHARPFLFMEKHVHNVRQAEALIVKIAYQLRPPTTTTMAPCRRCGRRSPGGQPCADCLSDDLGELINNKGAVMRWVASLKAAAQDEQTILSYARKSSPS